MGTASGVIFGTVLKIARDGEVKVLFDNTDAMWYPPQAIQLADLDSPDESWYAGPTLVKED